MSGDRRAEATILLKPADGPWEAVAGGEARGVTPQALTCSVNEGGPDTLSFGLRRDPAIPYHDLAAFNQCEVLIDEETIWGGRVWEVPQMAGVEDIVQVQGRGWQYHLDDDPVDLYFVHTDGGEWKDYRSYPGANLGFFRASGAVNGLTFGWPQGAYAPNVTAVGITLDLGPNRTAKKIVVDFDTVNPGGFAHIYARSHDAIDFSGSVSDAFSGVFNVLTSPANGTFSTGYRYVTLFMYRSDGISADAGADSLFRPSRIQVFADTAYEGSGESVLTLDQVLEVLLATGAAPLLDVTTSQISASSFGIPDLSPQGYQTLRTIAAAANAYEGNLVGVDAHRRLFSRERATVPELEIGEWSGAQFNDASTNSAEGLYDRVLVQGQTPSGVPVSVMRSVAGGLIALQGFHRTAIFPVSSPITDLIAEQLGDVWLAERSTPKFKGTATATGYGAVRRVTGGFVHSSELLLQGGNLLRVGHLITPEGEVGRDGIMRSVQYTHDNETATAELDNERGNFDTFMARLGVLTTRSIRG